MPPSFESMYARGKELTLYPYSPAEPHGSGQYIDNPLPDDLPVGWIRGFDPTSNVPPHKRALIKIAKRLSVGRHRRAQVLVCTLRVAPRQRPNGPSIPRDLKHLVAKVFDPMFYGEDCGAPFDTPQQQADGNLSREAGAYKYLFEHNMTGGMQLVPEYYGSWAIKFNAGKNKDGSTKFRCVGLVLMEYIVGVSISDLCVRDEYSEFLVVEDDELATGVAGQDTKCIPIDLDLRKAVMRMAIRGIVQHLHIGVEHYVISPENLFVALNDGPLGNLAPRAVMLDYTLTQIWSKTEWATDPNESPKHCLQLLPHPVHPLERFSTEALEEFIGWYPLAPNEWSEERQEYCGPEVDNEGDFTKWLIHEFGPLVEGENDKGECYSTFATLYEIERQLEEEEEEKEKIKAEEEKEKKRLAQLATDEVQSAPQTPTSGRSAKKIARDAHRQLMARQPKIGLFNTLPFSPKGILRFLNTGPTFKHGNGGNTTAPQTASPSKLDVSPHQSSKSTTPRSLSTSPEKGRGVAEPDLPSDLSGSFFMPTMDESDDMWKNASQRESSGLPPVEPDHLWMTEIGELVAEDDEWEDTSGGSDAQDDDARVDDARDDNAQMNEDDEDFEGFEIDEDDTYDS